MILHSAAMTVCEIFLGSREKLLDILVLHADCRKAVVFVVCQNRIAHCNWHVNQNLLVMVIGHVIY